MSEKKLEVAEIQAAIQQVGAQWLAGNTSISVLSRAEQQKRLGVVPRPGDAPLEQVERMVDERKAQLMAERAVNAPSAYDLRNVNGQNFITSIKDQGGCGSCVAFGTVAVIESTLRVQQKDVNLNIDLSEAQLFYCHGKERGRNCDNGWWPTGADGALEACKNLGIADETCYPYVSGDQNCNVCGDWQNRAYKVNGHREISSTAEMKEWISTRGPLTGCFLVYSDFFSYRSGVYRHVAGDLSGGHCVAIVGYDDAAGCWICKNSWGTGWGDQGFFRIGYGECGIESWYGPCAVEGVSFEPEWMNGVHVVGLWTINEQRNAWVYVDGGIGWKKLAFDNDNIFFDMLYELTTAKAGNRPVNLRQQQNIIKQVYVW
ncbi:MAG: C1 family peptidase [Caldilineaceae bacterium]